MKKQSPYSGEPVVESPSLPVTIKVTKKIQSLIDAHLIYDGQVTGQHYEWDRAGAVVDVDEQDANELLSKRRGNKPCCGESMPPKIFQLAE